MFKLKSPLATALFGPSDLLGFFSTFCDPETKPLFMDLNLKHDAPSSASPHKVIKTLGVDDNRHAAVLKKQQNFDAPISNLPNEILIKIFTIYKNEFDPWDDSTPLRLVWHRVAHVCQHWRHVALHAASLWTEPPTESYDYTLLMLERSQQAPLSIRLHSRSSNAIQAAVLQHVRRIDCLILDSPKEELDELQATLLALDHDSFSQLRALHVYGQVESSDDLFKLSTPTFRYASSLKLLWVMAIDLDWKFFPIPTLTSLQLYHVRISVSPSWKQFQDVLCAMPLLKSLHFSFGDLGINTPPTRLEPFELPFLSELELHRSDLWVTQAFLHSLTLSSTRRLRYASFECLSNDSNTPHDYLSIIRTVLSLHIKGNFGPFEKLRVSHNDFIISPNQENTANFPDLQLLQLMVVLDDIFYLRDKGRFASNLMSEITTHPDNLASSIVHLSVVYAHLSPQQFITLFGHLPHLERITSHEFTSLPIIESLGILPATPSDTPIPFAKLNAIELNEGGRKQDYSPELLEKLIDCLMMRCEYGAGVDYISARWKLTRREARRLREIVVNVNIKD